MLYLVGGVYRTGKTTLAQRFLEAKSVPFVSTDSLLHMVKNAAPELGVTDKLPLEQKAENFFPFLEQFAKYALYGAPNYLIEGDAFYPAHATKLQKVHQLKAVFLGFSAIDPQKLVEHAGHNNWIGGLNAKELKDLADEMVRLSKHLQSECKKFGLKYIDLAGDYEARHKEALDYLTS